MTNGSEAVLVEVEDHVALLTLNRPEAMNAMNRDLSRALSAGLDRINQDPEVRVGIITGNGRAFCAGADLKERAQGGDSGAQWHSVEGYLNGYGSTPQPTMKPLIAAINGFALAGGFELALRCDLLIASSNARFGLPEIHHGFFPGGGGPQRLPLAIPRAVAMEMILTGDPIDAATALEHGLVSRVVEPDELLPTSRRLALRIAEHNPLAVKAVKEVAYSSDDMTLQQALRFGNALRWIVGQTDEAKTGSQKWVDRR
jgi:enoyl-CoA hydratase/carnithine racemase